MAENGQGRIERLAGQLRVLVWVVIAAAAGLYLAARLGLGVGHVKVVARAAVELEVPWLWVARDFAALLILLSLWQLASMLGLIRRGARFSPPVTRRFRGFALLLFFAAALTLLAPLVALFVSPPDPHRIQIPLNFRDIWTMVVTGVLFLVARLLDEAQRIESDLSEIV